MLATALGLLFLVLILGLAVLAIIYVPLIPLFVQTWFVELFGDVNAETALPALTMLVVVAMYSYQNEGVREALEPGRLKLVIPSVLLLTLGAAIFGQAWEVMQLQKTYLASQDAFSRPPCADFASMCLIEDNAQRPEQVFKAWLGAIFWYTGVAIWLGQLPDRMTEHFV